MRQWLLILGVALGSGCASTEGLPSKNEVIAHTLATTVQVAAERPGGSRRLGSGILLGSDPHADRTLVLTAHHVVGGPDDGRQLSVRFPSGPRPEAEALQVASDPENDLALLAITGLDVPGAQLRQEAFLGDEVWVVAFPWGRQRTVVKGVVSQIRTPDGHGPAAPIAGPVRLIDASVSYGMSGGGVFDAGTGDLLGVVRGYRTGQLSVQGADAAPLQVPLGGETTVISAAQIVCFLAAGGFWSASSSVAAAAHCRADG